MMAFPTSQDRIPNLLKGEEGRGIKSETWLACARTQRRLSWIAKPLRRKEPVLKTPFYNLEKSHASNYTPQVLGIVRKQFEKIDSAFFLFEHAKPPVERSSVHEVGPLYKLVNGQMNRLVSSGVTKE
jgi:hypothetical protein